MVRTRPVSLYPATSDRTRGCQSPKGLSENLRPTARGTINHRRPAKQKYQTTPTSGGNGDRSLGVAARGGWVIRPSIRLEWDRFGPLMVLQRPGPSVGTPGRVRPSEGVPRGERGGCELTWVR